MYGLANIHSVLYTLTHKALFSMLLGNMYFSLLSYKHIHRQAYAIDNKVNRNLLSTKNVLHIVLSSLNNVIVNSYLPHVYQAFHTHYI